MPTHNFLVPCPVSRGPDTAAPGDEALLLIYSIIILSALAQGPDFFLDSISSLVESLYSYLWHINAGADPGTLDALYDDLYTSVKNYEISTQAVKDGLDHFPIPF